MFLRKLRLIERKLCHFSVSETLALWGPPTKLWLSRSIRVQQSNSSPAQFKDQFTEEWKDLGSRPQKDEEKKKKQTCSESRIERDDSRPRRLVSLRRPGWWFHEPRIAQSAKSRFIRGDGTCDYRVTRSRKEVFRHLQLERTRSAGAQDRRGELQ